METATVITEGQSQTIRFPEGFRIPTAEVYLRRIGQSIVLIPKGINPWDIMVESLDHFTEDFLADRNQPGQQPREDPFG
jgi:antitoxin VapB